MRPTVLMQNAWAALAAAARSKPVQVFSMQLAVLLTKTWLLGVVGCCPVAGSWKRNMYLDKLVVLVNIMVSRVWLYGTTYRGCSGH